ncbi:FkbM family methyltransferase [Halobellus ruber]|uniref:FkbM family methyltransferase n=1 Tax=Halobellus ruber TaxID=2761102 RepID=A0A7J9SFG6_9EURY|nr:FkbM family methyltransferase [Halobellus ruber]MBB6644717.1 FkbM family methyltransferase [Halobellus ruber]
MKSEDLEYCDRSTGRSESFDSTGDYLRKIREVLARGDLFQLVHDGVPFVHDRIVRPHLPRVYETEYNGVTVCPGKPLDRLLPWIDHGPEPNHESALVDIVATHVCPGDNVVAVGGGWGVTTTHAAERVGDEGSVVVYEGSAAEVEKIQETTRRNGVADRVKVEHVIVGTAISLRGEPGDAAVISPLDLPACDILILDCEGAEIEILQNLEIEPRIIAVESHGHYDAPSDIVARELSELGYEIITKTVADEGQREACVEKDVYVLAGVVE